MNIVTDLGPFLKRLNEVEHLFDLQELCRDISKNSSLVVKKKLLEVKSELHIISILGEPWQRKKPNSELKLCCGKCGKKVGPEEIKRNGHYRKGLN